MYLAYLTQIKIVLLPLEFSQIPNNLMPGDMWQKVENQSAQKVLSMLPEPGGQKPRVIYSEKYENSVG